MIPIEIGGVADLNYPTSKTRRGRVQGNGMICPTLTTENIPSVLEDWTWEIDGERYLIRIRKLTPRECLMLMDFDYEDYDKCSQENSNSQIYKQSGNSIVVNCLTSVFGQLFEGHEDDYKHNLDRHCTQRERERERELDAICRTRMQEQLTSALASKQGMMVESTDLKTREPELLNGI